MPDFGLTLGNNSLYTSVGDTANSRGVLCPNCGSAAHVKGNWGQVIASTPKDSAGLLVFFVNVGAATNSEFLYDIGVGASGSEQVLIANILYTGRQHTGHAMFFPIFVPAGTRLSTRIQNFSGGNYTGIYIQIVLLSQPLLGSSPLSVCTTYGANASTTRGVSIDPGAAANTKGAWTEIVASSNRLRYLGIAFGLQANTIRADGGRLFDIGIGAASSEQVIIPDIFIAEGGIADLDPPHNLWFPVDIPAGTRISVRQQSTITDATDRLLDIVLYGME